MFDMMKFLISAWMAPLFFPHSSSKGCLFDEMTRKPLDNIHISNAEMRFSEYSDEMDLLFRIYPVTISENNRFRD